MAHPTAPLRPLPGDEEHVAELPDFLPWLPTRRSARGWTPERQRGFLAALLRVPSVRHAAASVGMSARTAYALRDRPGAEGFAVVWDWALRQGRERVTQAVIDRCFNGEVQPIFRRGRYRGIRMDYNDRLAIAVMARGREDGARETRELDMERLRLSRWEDELRRRELDLEDPAHGDRLRSAEEHELWRRALAAEDRRARQATIRAAVRRQRDADRRAAAALVSGPRVRLP